MNSQAMLVVACYALAPCVACDTSTHPADSPDSDTPTLDGGGGVGSDGCDPSGTWRIEYDGDASDRCGPGTSETIIVSLDEDAGTDMVTFENRGIVPSQCGPQDNSTYEASLTMAATGCSIKASSTSRWCLGSEPWCEELELELHIGRDRAEVTGTFRRCWCSGSWSMTQLPISGTATRIE